MDYVKILIGKIASLIINPLIILGFVIATIYLFYAIVQMIWGAGDKTLEEKKKTVMWGVVGMFIMFSVFGILRLVMATFKLTDCTGIFFCQ